MLACHRLVLRLLTVRATPRAPSANAVLTDAASILLAERSCSPEPHRFAALRAETAAAFPGGAHMVSGAQQGRLLHMLVKLARAQRVLEVGCFTGYAALWMALALPPDGSLVSLERDERCAAVARKHLDAAGVASRVELSSVLLDDHPAGFDVAVWHGHRQHDVLADDEALLRDVALNRLAPHGVLVLVQPPEHEHTGVILEVLRTEAALEFVSLPSPDGQGGLVTLVSAREQHSE